jgi:molybdenum cofactor synthesis domain-containing protein
MPKAAVITVSDRCSRGESVDSSGPAVRQFLETNGFQVLAVEIVPDEIDQIQAMLIRLCAAAELVVTTGGTGIAARDVTPEATRGVCARLIDGISEHMRAEGAKKTPLAALSRGVCGVRGQSLILNVPGSLKGAVESLSAVIGLLPHALDLLRGQTAHSA